LVTWTLAWCSDDTNNKTDNQNGTIENVTIENSTNNLDTVINYNNTLVDITKDCIETAYTTRWILSSESTIQEMEDSTNKAIEDCTNSINSINNLWERENDSSLKDGALNLLNKYVTWFTKFKEVIPYINGEVSTDNEDWNFDNIMKEISEIGDEINTSNFELSTIQDRFAEAYGFPLETIEDNYEVESTDKTKDTYTTENNDELVK